MLIAAREFNANFGKYFALPDQKEIILTQNGKMIARISKDYDEKFSSLRSFFDIFADPLLVKAMNKELRDVPAEERRKRYENIN